jgi:hypothetical protein
VFFKRNLNLVITNELILFQLAILPSISFEVICGTEIFPLEALEQISWKIIKSTEQMSIIRKFEEEWYCKYRDT